MENCVYICSWRHEGSRYHVWVRDRPAVRAEDASFEQADIALAYAICGAFGDGEGVHEYDRPRPGATEVPGLVAVVASLGGNSWATVENLEELYVAARCPRCRWGGSVARTAAPARLSGIESGMDGGTGDRSAVRFFSEAFLDLLTPAERALCTWRRVDRTGRARKVYYELVESRFCAPEVALSSSVEDLWRVDLARAQGESGPILHCELCGRETHPSYLFMPRGLPRAYINVAAVPAPLPACFTIGGPGHLTLCLARERWQALLGKPGTRGISSFEIGVVASSLVDPNPPRRFVPVNLKGEG